MSPAGHGCLGITATAAKTTPPSHPAVQISFPIANMLCDGVACAGTKGRFKVVAFGALSRFAETDGSFQTDYKDGRKVMVADADLPSSDIFYGEWVRGC